MSFLQKKSIENYNAYVYLSTYKVIYSPAIHCGYYSCLQRIIFILMEFFPDEFNAIKDLSNVRRKGNLHKEYIEEISRQIEKYNKRDSKKFSTTFKDLKDFRIKSDYKNIEIEQPEFYIANQKFEEIRRLIKKYFNIDDSIGSNL